MSNDLKIWALFKSDKLVPTGGIMPAGEMMTWWVLPPTYPQLKAAIGPSDAYLSCKQLRTQGYLVGSQANYYLVELSEGPVIQPTVGKAVHELNQTPA